MQKNKLYKVEELEDLNYEEIISAYRDHINSSQADILRNFTFGRELFSHARGSYLFSKSGRKVFDATTSSGVMGLGHNHPRILKCRSNFSKKSKIEIQKLIFSPYQAALAHNIANLTPGKLEKVFFCNSGAEAIDAAIKLAYKYHDAKRQTILVSDIAFHGCLLGSCGLTSEIHKYFKFPELMNVVKYRFDDIKDFQDKVDTYKDEIFLVMVEPFSASSMLSLSDNFLNTCRSICTNNNILLCSDEVFTGWGKTGDMFAFEKSGIYPDIITTSKTLGGGKASISAMISDSHIFSKSYENMKDAFLHSTTFLGMSEECVTAIEALNIIVEDECLSRVRRIEESIKKYSSILLLNNKIKEVRGRGSLFGIVLENNFFSFVKEALKLIPIEMTQDEGFIKKLYLSSLMSHLYEKYDVLCALDTHYDIPLSLSFSYFVDESEIEYVMKSISAALSESPIKLIAKFVKMRVTA